MAQIKIDETMLRSDSQSLQAKIQELTELNSNLEALIVRIGDSWEGDASRAYTNMMQNYAKKAADMVAVLTEFKSYVDSAVTKFESADKNAASRLRGAF